MNFNKQFKKRYNKHWNEVVVSAYKGIKAYRQSSSSSGFFATPVAPLIDTYCDGVLTIINNLSRQLPFFDDRKYAENYLKQTRSEAICDLNKFKTHLKNPWALAKIEQTLAALNSPAQEAQNSVATAIDSLSLPSTETTDIEMAEAKDGSEQFEHEWKEMMDEFDKEHSLMNVFPYSSASNSLLFSELSSEEDPKELGSFFNG